MAHEWPSANWCVAGMTTYGVPHVRLSNIPATVSPEQAEQLATILVAAAAEAKRVVRRRMAESIA